MKESYKKFTEEIAKALLDRLHEKEAQENIQKIKSASNTGRFKVVISTSDLDRHGESVNQSGWELGNYKKNPIVLWAHDHWSMPIGLTESIDVIDGKLVAEGVFAPAEVNPLAQQVRAAYEAGIVTATSVGFIVKEMIGNEITKAELLEFSFVPVPANPAVADLMKQRNLDFAEFMAKGLILNSKEGEPVENGGGSHASDPVSDDNSTDDPKPTDSEKPTDESGNGEVAENETDPVEAEKTAKKKTLTPEDAGAILTDMQSKVDTAITDASIAIQELLQGEESSDDKTVGESKVKAGRVLSEKNRKLVKGVIDSLNQLTASLQELYEATEPEGGKGEEPPIEKNAAPNEKVEAPGGDAELVMKSLDDFLATRRVLRIADNAIGSALESVNKKIKERSQTK